MALTFDKKFKELEQTKSELDLDFLKKKKKEFEEKMYEILDSQSEGIDGDDAISELNKVKSYRTKIKEIDKKIQNNPQFLEDVDRKISFYEEKRQKVNDMLLYSNTEEGIAEILGSDPLYQYALESENKEIIDKLKNRKITPKEYENKLEQMYNDLFIPLLKRKEKSEIQQTPKVVIHLPEGMSEQINEELINSKNIKPKEIESFLKKELKKNAGEIKISHIKNTFKNNFDQAYQYIKRLIINYPGFIIIDSPQIKHLDVQVQSKREKLVSQTCKETEEKRNIREEKERLLSRVYEISQMDKLENRIFMYISLYEQLGCKFVDKNDFLNELYKAINTYNHIPLERAIQKNLISIIKDILHPMKLEKYGYFAYKFGRSCDNRRIVMYPNGEIFKICSHTEYERIINSKPPVDKVV